MSVEYPKAFVQQFADNLIHLAQQKGSRLMRTVKMERVNGKYHHFDRLGATTAQKRVSRHGDTPLISTPHSRRRVSMEDWEWADLVDSQDKIRALINPTSDYALAGAWAIGRAIDDEIIAKANGNSVSVDANDATSNVAFDANMIVGRDFAAANSNLLPEKVYEARHLLRSKDIDMDEEMFLVINSDAYTALMNDSNNLVSSSDYNLSRPLATGDLPSYHGFQIITLERLTGSGTAADPYQGLAYTKSAIGLGLGQDINVRISERDDKSYSTQVYASATFGAVRVEEEKITQINMQQTA